MGDCADWHPPRRLEATPCVARLMTEQETLAQTPCMPLDAHKGHRGHVLVVGGSLGMAGAPALAAISALRVGAGLATVATPRASSRRSPASTPK